MDPSPSVIHPPKGPSFDVNSWISQNIGDLQEGVDHGKVFRDMEVFLNEEIQKTTGAINQLTQQVVMQVPRVAREFEVTHEEVNKLQQEITSGFNEAENVQKQTTASMTTLERLDNIKTNLLLTSSALQEADKWTSLGKDVEQLLDSGDVHKSFECIVGMERSLGVLDQSTSEERKLILEEVKNRLEALATKHIIQAFETNDVDNASKFFTMFATLERTTQYIKYFQNSEKIKLTQEWRNYVELMSFKDSVAKFYDDILDHLNAKVRWCKIVFGDKNDELALNVVLGLYTETLEQLEPSLQYCFEVEAKKVPFLDLLLKYNQLTHRLAQNLRQFIETNCNAKPSPGKILSLLKVLFSPFQPQYSKYAKHHENLVVSKIQEAVKSILSTSAVSTTEASTLLQERIDCAKRLLPEIVLSVKEGEEKITLLNHGYGYYHFGKGVNAGLEKFKDWCTEILRILEKSTTLPERQRSLLENSLSFGETCGDVLQQIIQLDNSITGNCIKLLSKLNTPFQSEWEAFTEIYLDSSILGEITLFQQRKESLLVSSVNQFKKLCKDVTVLILKVTAEPIENQLKRNFVLSDCNLKEAIPSEYITQVGEYLMLLPQNLDPFIATEASSLSHAFDQSGDDETKSPVDYILSNVSMSICEAYSERLFKITYLSDGQAKQLAQDIDYLASVLEDLGGKLTPELLDFSKLMKIYPSINESTNIDKVSSRIMGIVKKMKTVPVSE